MPKRGLIRVLCLSAALLAAPAWNTVAQQVDQQEPDAKLPNGKSQSEAILKDEHEKTMRDVAQLQKLAADLKEELEKNDYHVLAISALKKTEEIEKLARRVRGRLRH